MFCMGMLEVFMVNLDLSKGQLAKGIPLDAPRRPHLMIEI